MKMLQGPGKAVPAAAGRPASRSAGGPARAAMADDEEVFEVEDLVDYRNVNGYVCSNSELERMFLISNCFLTFRK